MLGYLASPYSHPDPKVQEQRANQVAEMAVKLINSGLNVISPIVHNTGLIQRCEQAKIGGWVNWGRLDESMIYACDYMIIYRMNGWDESVGVDAEFKICQRLNRPVFFIDDDSNVTSVIDEVFSHHKFSQATDCGFL